MNFTTAGDLKTADVPREVELLAQALSRRHGEVRVARGTPHGRAIELYRVQPGELCVVSAACLFGQAVLSAHGVAVQPSRLLLLPAPVFMRWSDHEPFRRHVFALFAARMAKRTTPVFSDALTAALRTYTREHDGAYPPPGWDHGVHLDDID